MGDIIIDKNSKVENKDVEELLKKNCSESEIQIFNAKKELDCAVTLGELRFRANFYKTLTGTAAVFRKVETKIPSHINFFIIIFLPFTICNDAVCLLCLKSDISLIAIAVFFTPLFVVTTISSGEIFIILDLFISL